ncbi:PAN2-PAN3 deadenylation complex subunit PAN3 [Apis cerana]|uniref:PAN2-PAN3 deadenylation complex subunit PAN3 n=1 Tax=Apis mellifera TaxID=7460 RepID=A0A7M7IGY6_APIME|nr:PAN2-PAN3 deadenylation complex subunit PAN3 [Apis mellifera]XP_016768502.1 PAN2-PAN3 deadenylation complex subunit PAN3 [Apis mellifera]XP_016768503.1 PAN2-PAN3 deadenylation complex subunit PAN3 [Apis mellifera]XP_016768504.1 PAN2-PAN3 deadenylation complex subunit PAN3 [Apis mellifera]XP_016918182.1 PAN2-PAN3 deadenylation complex subunit PAN3 [Apis cerana]XP_016918183.1 PAN2-PAN3 deadenylation complex subunit PAN3 [Apis cerana]XP_016918184.1 PAN2-PAN3 deadenylation complex subunit PAN3|eukprot:XP_006570154.1 PAN2-PAN3 deadenylation complex subunit PAN3 [Apis mellifera]
MDPSMFVTYTPQTNGVPLESKLATYMNRQSPGVTLSTTTITKHLSNLSLDSQKKVTASPEFVPGRGLTNSNSSSPNLFNNSYHSQENVGGTTYFYLGNAVTDTVGTEDGTETIGNVGASQIGYVYPGTPAHLQPVKPTKPPSSNSSSAPSTPPPQAALSFFVSESLRMDILQKNALTLAQPDIVRFPDLPNEVDNYHELCPLEPIHKPASTILGYQTSTYKATSIKSGTRYCLRRIHDFRLANTKCMVLVDMWKRLSHTNLVQLREVFTTKAFGDNSMIFVYDYHPGSETLLTKHFSATELNGYTDPFSSDPNAPRPYSHTKNTILRQQHSSMLPESVIWSYIIQLTAALRVIHAAGLAYRCLDPTKVLLTSRTRLRLSCAAIPDVVTYDGSSSNPLSLIPHYQQEDLIALGKLVLALACRSLLAVHRDNMQASLELVARSYSTDLRNLILYLLSNQARKSVTDLMPMIGARFYTQLDAAQLRSDVLENELAKELENGRLFKLLVKLATINERPELNMEPTWAETGDRYMLKLFRDYVFHQVAADGRPWLDMAHVVSCLNKLDSGSQDKICLMSRDEQSVLVVSYAELRQCLETSFGELVQSAKETV